MEMTVKYELILLASLFSSTMLHTSSWLLVPAWNVACNNL